MGRLALVTGGTRGIGAAISVRLKNAGYQVVASYGGNDQTAHSFRETYDIPVVKFDVGQLPDCTKAIEQVTAELGAVEILVNNAGITRDATLHKMPENHWQDVINTNLNSCYNVTRAVIDAMRSGGFGRIVNITSINGLAGQIGQTNYAAAKAGMIGFTKALALENANKGITVNAVAPGYINTEMMTTIPANIMEKIIARIPVGRLGEVEEIARCVEFLVADEAAFITGSTLSANGGQYLD